MIEEVDHVLMDQRVFAHIILELVQLCVGRQPAGQEEISNLDEETVLGQLDNVIAAIAKNALFAVKIGDARLAGTGIHETAVQGDITGIAKQGSDIDRPFSGGALDNRKFMGNAVDDQARILL